MTIRRRTLALGGVAALALPALARAQSGPIKFGFTAALTGPFNEFGEGINRGAQIAVEECNKAGGIKGRMVELAEVLDDQLVPDRAVQNMRRILDNKEIVGLMAPSGSGPTLAVIDMVQADGRPIINPQAQTPAVVYPQGADKPPRPNVFSVSVSNSVDAEKLGSALAGFRGIGIIHESTAFGVTGADLVRKDILARKRDARITVESYNQRAQDMTAQLIRVQRAGAEALLIIGLGADAAVIRRNMTRLNMNILLYGTAGVVTVPYIEGAGDLVVGTRATNLASFGRRPMPPASQKFVDLYRAKFGTDRWFGPDPENPLVSLAGTVASGYDCINLLIDAARRAGSTAPQDMIAALDATTDFPGATIPAITFTPQIHAALKVTDLGVYEMVKRGDRVVFELRD